MSTHLSIAVMSKAVRISVAVPTNHLLLVTIVHRLCRQIVMVMER